jgi:F-type H+-transporting ATPase subunit delta
MASTDEKNSTATVFARSLLELAQAQNQAEPVGQELKSLRQVVEADPAFLDFFSNPSVGRDARAKIVDDVIASKASPLVRNFVRVANEHNVLRHLPLISEAYDDLLDEMLGKVEVDVTVAQRLTPEQLENVRQKVGQAIKKDAVVHQYVDESIIGGMVLKVGDQVIDGSVKVQLESLRQKLLSAGQR